MSTEPRALVFEVLSKERVLVSVHGSEATAEQWNAYLDCMRGVKSNEDMRFLVRIEGPPPSPALQARIADVARGEKWRVALVSSSAAMRFVVSAFSFVNKTIRFFSPEQVRQALEHLGCTPAEQLVVEAALARLMIQSRS